MNIRELITSIFYTNRTIFVLTVTKRCTCRSPGIHRTCGPPRSLLLVMMVHEHWPEFYCCSLQGQTRCLGFSSVGIVHCAPRTEWLSFGHSLCFSPDFPSSRMASQTPCGRRHLFSARYLVGECRWFVVSVVVGLESLGNELFVSGGGLHQVLRSPLISLLASRCVGGSSFVVVCSEMGVNRCPRQPLQAVPRFGA